MFITTNPFPAETLGSMAPSMGAQGSLPFIEEYELTGTVERVTYFNPENGQCVIEVKPDNSKSRVLVTGFTASVYPGVTVVATGSYKEIEGTLNAKHLDVKTPLSARALKKFLKSGALPGIGDHLAKILSQAFPQNFFLVLDEQPEALKKIPGIGTRRQAQIIEAWAEFKYITAFEHHLFARHLPVSWARDLWPHHGFDSLNFLKENPYRVVREFDFSFELVDQMTLKDGGDALSLERVRCGLHECLKNHYKQGDCAQPEENVLRETTEKLSVPRDRVEEALELELLEENFIAESIKNTPCVYLRNVWETEQNVARHLLAFENRETPWSFFNFHKVLHWAQNLLSIELAPLQIKAIETALSSPLTVITGGPGTGKTTLIRSLVTILKTQFAPFALCSPTGRGAQRLEEATGAPAQTIHRLLKYDAATGHFIFNKNNPLNLDLVLVDEVSMVDLTLMSHLLDALPPHCALILVGDKDQIPPVGAGHILQSLMEAARFPTVVLTDIFRQKDKSFIKLNAQRINRGEMPSLGDAQSDFHYIPVQGAEAITNKLLQLITKELPEKYNIRDSRDVQVLVPLNRGPLGTVQLNQELQRYMSQVPQTKQKTITGFEQQFKTGDKVMVTKNDYRKEVFNGDIGFIRDIDHFEQIVEIDFDQRRVFYHFEELDRLTLAYAISVHKSQGSEYRAVIVVIAGEHLPLAQRQLIYTAVTRGKEQVFLVAEPQALQTAVLSDENNMRWQKLSELLSSATAT